MANNNSIRIQLCDIRNSLSNSFIILGLLCIGFFIGGIRFMIWGTDVGDAAGNETYASGLLTVAGGFLGTVLCTLLFEIINQAKKKNSVEEAIRVVDILISDDQKPAAAKMPQAEYAEFVETLNLLYEAINADTWSKK